MKNLFKKMLVVSCLLTLGLSMTACAKKEEPLSYDSNNATQISNYIVQNLYQFTDTDVANIKDTEVADIESAFKNQGVAVDGSAFITGIDSWMSAKEEMGGIVSIDSPSIESTSSEIRARFPIKGEKRNATCIITMSGKLKVTSITVNCQYTIAEKMEKAALNTVLGMGTTFIILIFLSLVISLFAFIPKIQAAFSKKDAKAAKTDTEAAVDNTISQIIANEETFDDGELNAVIAAAIAAYEESAGGNASGDGFVVRSIRRHF